MSFILTKGVLQQQVNRKKSLVPTDGLISYWKLDETSGPVMDSWGDNDGTNEGALRGVEGKVGNAFEFGNDGYTYVDTGYYPETTNKTLVCWVFFYEKDQQQVAVGCNDGINRRFYIGMSNHSRSLVGYNDSYNTRKGSKLNKNEWIFMALRGEDGTASVFLNGEKEFEFIYSTKERISNDPLSIGGISNTFKMLGKMDEVGVWDRALTDEEITQLYNEGKGTTL